MRTYTIDPDRQLPKDSQLGTGIFVRALGPDGRIDDYDIVEFDAKSLLAWLRSRGGKNEWAESVVANLLGWSSTYWTEIVKAFVEE